MPSPRQMGMRTLHAILNVRSYALCSFDLYSLLGSLGQPRELRVDDTRDDTV